MSTDPSPNVPAYTAILKSKEGELRSLGDLDSTTKKQLRPLVEVIAPGTNWSTGAPKPLAVAIEKNVKSLAKNWGAQETIAVDLVAPPSEPVAPGIVAVDMLFDGLAAENVKSVPVTGLRREMRYQNAVARVAARDGQGIAIRLTLEDDDRLAGLRALCEDLGVDPSEVDLVVDLAEIPIGYAASYARLAYGMLVSIPQPLSWRSTTLAGSAFPVNLSAFRGQRISTTPRSEWQLYLDVIRRDLPRVPSFGDYAVQHPRIVDLDPRLMRMSASIRYASEDEWLIVKGGSIGKHGWEQTQQLCAELVKRPEFMGASFSWGDRYIDRRAIGSETAGNATTWRRVGTTHHLTLAAAQIASLNGV